MPRVEDYALIGDLQTAALVSRDGSIDWCCFPRFDSGACFAALLGNTDHGRWLLAPAAGVHRSTRRYRHDTLILESIHETDEGTVRAVDFMPPSSRAQDIVRIVEGLDGSVPMRSELVIRFDYGQIVPWVRRIDAARVAVAGPDALCFRTPVETHGEGMATVSEFTLRPGERVPFVLTWYPSHEELPESIDAEQALAESEDFWLDWAGLCNHHGDYHDEIHQSLLVLKALTHNPTGGIVAAPTTSLPELVGGSRNWDYRFCWLRDATLTLLAMLNAGYRDEAQAWRTWLLRAVAGDPADLQIMYGIAGERRLDERELEWLPGYEQSLPVRVGNAASRQLQLDIYGEVLDAGYQTLAHGIKGDPNAWSLLRNMLAWLEDGWRKADAGIWEVRGPARHFTHSKVMAWVAFDRAVRFHDQFGREGPVDRWRALRDEIHAEVLDRAWSEKAQAFSQSYDSDELDASSLLMPLVGFLPASDERVVATVEAIRRELTVDGLVLRYRPREDAAVDGITEGRACSFRVPFGWQMYSPSRAGSTRPVSSSSGCSICGTTSVSSREEYDPVSGRQLGNFPQAFTHLALVNTAMILSQGRSLRHIPTQF